MSFESFVRLRYFSTWLVRQRRIRLWRKEYCWTRVENYLSILETDTRCGQEEAKQSRASFASPLSVTSALHPLHLISTALSTNTPLNINFPQCVQRYSFIHGALIPVDIID